MAKTSKKKPSAGKSSQIRISVYFESKADLLMIREAAAKAQLRRNPIVSQYVAQAAKQLAQKELAVA